MSVVLSVFIYAQNQNFLLWINKVVLYCIVLYRTNSSIETQWPPLILFPSFWLLNKHPHVHPHILIPLQTHRRVCTHFSAELQSTEHTDYMNSDALTCSSLRHKHFSYFIYQMLPSISSARKLTAACLRATKKQRRAFVSLDLFTCKSVQTLLSA